MNIREYYNLKTLQLELKEYAQMAQLLIVERWIKGKIFYILTITYIRFIG